MAPAASQLFGNIHMCLPEPSAETKYPNCRCRSDVCPEGLFTLACTDVAEIPKNVTTDVNCL